MNRRIAYMETELVDRRQIRATTKGYLQEIHVNITSSASVVANSR